VKIFLAIPVSWKNNSPSTTPIINGSTDILQLFKHNANEIWSSRKSVYFCLIENEGPVKQQCRWKNDLDISNSINPN